MPSSACLLHLDAVLLPSKLKKGQVVQVACEQRFIKTLTMPSFAWFLQYVGAVLLKTPCVALNVQESFEQIMLDPQ